MQINNKDQVKKSAHYGDWPNSFLENIGETVGIIVLILFVGAFVYLVMKGIPTIRIALALFLQVATGLFAVHH